MRKPRRITLAKETLRDLQEPLLKVAGAVATGNDCVGPLVAQHTCAYSNCGSCFKP